MLEDEKKGLNLTASFEGCINIDMDNPNRMIVTGNWEKENITQNIWNSGNQNVLKVL